MVCELVMHNINKTLIEEGLFLGVAPIYIFICIIIMFIFAGISLLLSVVMGVFAYYYGVRRYKEDPRWLVILYHKRRYARKIGYIYRGRNVWRG
jgi:hypothetical protein